MLKETDPILTKVNDFLAERGIAASAFGMQAVGDPNFVIDLRAGRELRRATRRKVELFMATYKPGQHD